MRPWIARAIVVRTSRLFGFFVVTTSGNQPGLPLSLLLSPRSLATMRTLGWLSRAARSHDDELEIP